MRRVPKSEKPPLVTKRVHKDDDPKRILVETRSYKLLTPLFGGGVIPKESDPVTVVRATEIRGHLRFWWRATQGGRFGGDLQEMRREEARLWGSAASGKDNKGGPSKVSIVLKKWEKDINQILPFDESGKEVKGTGIPGYAAFPLQLTKEEIQKGISPKYVQRGVTFTVEISYPISDGQAVKASLWAWETFGGIGGRTRRGFGAIQRTDVTYPKVSEMQGYIERSLAAHVVEGIWPKDVPHLQRDLSKIRFTKAFQEALQTWSHLTRRLRSFRQYRLDKDTGAFKEHGKPVWPEPNAIREVTRDRRANFAEGPFPRAAFGLPVIFHFALPKHDKTPDETLKGAKNEQGKHYERLASPLILRPISCAEEKFVGLAIVLDSPRTPPGGLFLDGKGFSGKVNNRELNSQEISRIKPMNGKSDVLMAFLDWVSREEEGATRR